MKPGLDIGYSASSYFGVGQIDSSRQARNSFYARRKAIDQSINSEFGQCWKSEPPSPPPTPRQSHKIPPAERQNSEEAES